MVRKNRASYPSGEKGYIYLWTLFAVALAGVGLAGVGPMWQIESQREKEMELLHVGDQFRRAIESYYLNSSGKAKRYPESLEQLLEDRSSLIAKRHLRKIFLDPMTNSHDWGLIEQAGSGITGIYSKSDKIPLKRTNFPEQYSTFSEAKSYQDWKFVHAGGGTGGTDSQRSKTPKSGVQSAPPTNPFASDKATAGSNPLSPSGPADSTNPFTQNPQ
jgi:type II secretory pathway pseudopilin PulG